VRQCDPPGKKNKRRGLVVPVPNASCACVVRVHRPNEWPPVECCHFNVIGWFREAWKDLLEQMSYRERRLAAAGEIHRFHRDVAEAMARITEKMAAIPDDKGRSLNSVLALLRRHEGFENDLLALEAQLQVTCKLSTSQR